MLHLPARPGPAASGPYPVSPDPACHSPYKPSIATASAGIRARRIPSHTQDKREQRALARDRPRGLARTRQKVVFVLHFPAFAVEKVPAAAKLLKMKVELGRLMQQHRVAPKSCTAIAPLPPVPYDMVFEGYCAPAVIDSGHMRFAPALLDAVPARDPASASP